MLHVVAGMLLASHIQPYKICFQICPLGVTVVMMQGSWLEGSTTASSRYHCNSKFVVSFEYGFTLYLNLKFHFDVIWIIFQGPLFQQRPYPSPGAVLRKIAEAAKQTKKSGSHSSFISKRGDGSDGLGEAD